jgi:hypothetical protein
MRRKPEPPPVAPKGQSKRKPVAFIID